MFLILGSGEWWIGILYYLVINFGVLAPQKVFNVGVAFYHCCLGCLPRAIVNLRPLPPAGPCAMQW